MAVANIMSRTMYGSIVVSVEESRQELSSHDRILEAARSLFSSDGYESTSTSAIARRAGTSESQLIKHFGSKEGLLEAIFLALWERLGPALEQAVAQADTPTAKLLAFSELMIRATERDEKLATLLFLEGRRIRRHGSLVLLTGGFLQFVEMLDRLLLQMQEAGELKPGLHLQAVRSAMIGGLEGMLRDQLIARRAEYPATYSGVEVRETYRALLTGFLVR
jgi:AcrR family transcriptional regulator